MIDRYMLPEFKQIWSQENKYINWLNIELAVLEALEYYNFIPQNTFRLIKNKTPTINTNKIFKIEQVVKHDVIAFIQFLEDTIGDDAKYLHFGITSSDILDTSFAIFLRDAINQIIKLNDELINALAIKVTEYSKTFVIGRSHGVHAEPTTFGAILAGYHAEFVRNKQRLQNIKDEISYGKISGAVGNYAHICPDVELFVLSRFNLKPETVSTQIIPRDRHANYFLTLALVAASIERLATNIRHMQRTEVNEVQEYFDPNQKGSSAMPHKRNPIASENLCGLARIVKGFVSTALDNVSLWHERDISHSSAERIMAPDATSLLGYMLKKSTEIINNLIINTDKMKSNILLTKGACFSENILLALINKGLSRQKAYALVQKAAFKAIEKGFDFENHLLLNDLEISKYLSQEETKECFNVENATKNCKYLIDRIYKDLNE